jgi:NAD(P)-dependent dehydrogenase (short-subunit alcohol dehydrogenase family)
MDSSSFEGKKILITGAASGIGKETSKYLAECGANVVGIDLNIEGLLAIEHELLKNSHLFHGIEANLQDENLEEVFESAVCDGIKFSGMVHCAGISSIVPLKSLSKKRLHTVMDINFYSFVELSRLFSKKKYSNGGSIVGVSSLAAQLPRAYELPYIASKAAMNAVIPCLAIELSKLGIRVNGIMPGVVDTGMVSAQQSEEQKQFIESMTKKTLLGAASPHDIATVISFLLSDQSRIITGRVIPVDGGMFL